MFVCEHTVKGHNTSPHHRPQMDSTKNSIENKAVCELAKRVMKQANNVASQEGIPLEDVPKQIGMQFPAFNSKTQKFIPTA